MKRLFAGLFLFCATTGATQSVRDLSVEGMSRENRIALVIGIGSYRFAPLKNPPNDARAMARALKTCGFDVIERIDSDKQGLVEAINQFGAALKHAGVGLAYYAGHGVQVAGHNYLIPLGANIGSEAEIESKGVSAALILAQMEASANRVNILIMDACGNNPFAPPVRGIAPRGLAPIDAASGSLIAYATAPGSVASDGKGENGLYTSMLLRHMLIPGITIERVLKDVRRDVKQISANQQVPWEASSLVGDFYFVLPGEDKPGRIELEDVLDKGDSALEQADYIQAIEQYHQALALDSEQAYIHNNLGVARKGSGDTDGAIAAYNEAIRLAPSWADPQFNLGLALRQKGDLNGAIAAYRNAVRLDAKFPPIFNNLGNALEDFGDNIGAIKAFREAIRLNSNYAIPHLNIGNLLARQGDTQGAIAAFEAAIERNPKWPTPRFNLGIALQVLGENGRAIEAFNGYIDVETNPKGISEAVELIDQLQ